MVIFLIKERPTSLYSAQVAASFFPPVALQLACGSYLRSHEGLSRGSICGIMVSTAAPKWDEKRCHPLTEELLCGVAVM